MNTKRSKPLLYVVLGLVLGAGVCIAGIVGWFIWGPVLHFILSLIPQSQYAWAGKIICYIAIAWFGGIGLPISILLVTIIAIVHLLDINGHIW